MFSFNGKSINNVSKALKDFEIKKSKILEDMNDIIVPNIQSQAPVITGNLRAGVRGDINGDYLDLTDTVEYFLFVNLGTYKQSANPFFPRGIVMSKTAVSAVIISGLRI